MFRSLLKGRLTTEISSSSSEIDESLNSRKMSSNELPSAGTKKEKDNLETDNNSKISQPLHGQSNIKMDISQTESKSSPTKESSNIDPAMDTSVSAPAEKALTSTTSCKPLDQRSEDGMKPKSAQSSQKPRTPSKSFEARMDISQTEAKSSPTKVSSNMDPDKDTFVSLPAEKAFTSTTSCKLLNRRSEDGTKPRTPNKSSENTKDAPFLKTKNKTNKDSSSTALSKLSAFYGLPNEWPLTMHNLQNSSLTLPKACKAILVLMKSKRSELKFQESKFDSCLDELQKLLLDAKQISLKLDAEADIVADEMREAVSKVHKLLYLLSVSSRVFEKLDECGSLLSKGLPGYAEETKNFDSSINNMFEYIMMCILEKCSRTGEKWF